MAYDILWRLHALLMTTAVLSLTTGIVVSLLFKKEAWRYRVHKILGGYAGVSGGAALLTALLMVGLSGGSHFAPPHGALGALGGAGLILTPLAGNRIRRARKKKRIKGLHKGLGYATAGLAGAALFTGLLLTGLLSLPG